MLCRWRNERPGSVTPARRIGGPIRYRRAGVRSKRRRRPGRTRYDFRAEIPVADVHHVPGPCGLRDSSRRLEDTGEIGSPLQQGRRGRLSCAEPKATAGRNGRILYTQAQREILGEGNSPDSEQRRPSSQVADDVRPFRSKRRPRRLSKYAERSSSGTDAPHASSNCPARWRQYDYRWLARRTELSRSSSAPSIDELFAMAPRREPIVRVATQTDRKRASDRSDCVEGRAVVHWQHIQPSPTSSSVA